LKKMAALHMKSDIPNAAWDVVWDVMEKFMRPLSLPNLRENELSTPALASGKVTVDESNKTLIDALVDGNVDVGIHCCNCFHVMGCGIARALRTRWPAVADADRRTPHGDVRKLGTWSTALVRDGTATIVNLYAQFGYGKVHRHLSYMALKHGIERLFAELKLHPGLRIGTYWARLLKRRWRQGDCIQDSARCLRRVGHISDSVLSLKS
jgi:hypothetical protein